MKIVTMLEFRHDAERVLRRVAKGERLVFSHRGKPLPAWSLCMGHRMPIAGSDPFLSIVHRSTPSPKGKNKHQDIDRILYGSR